MTTMTTRPRRRAGGVIAVTLALALMLAGMAALIMYLVAPEQTERLYGDAKTAVTASVDAVRAEVFDELPVVRLGITGGVADLDRCDGTFTEMASYEREGVPPFWAAHNKCGGDVSLPWELGQRVRIEGNDDVYEVVDIRAVSKTWSSTADLVGLSGELALQTCFYGENRMKFVGLAPVA